MSHLAARIESVADAALARAAPARRSLPGDARPVVIVGSGPAGLRVAQELARHVHPAPIVLYGAEPYEPYNRVRLSSYLAGDVDWAALTRDAALPSADAVETRFGCAVRVIDRARAIVVDALGREQPYGQLVLATGSRAHVPEIPNIRLAGVYTFRDLADAQTLSARQARSHRTVVLGGGLLGLEAARAMQRFNTEVTVIEHMPRLMPRQLDATGADVLLRHVERMGIRVLVGEAVRSVHGTVRVEGVELRSGARVLCDTLVVATGIRPNIELARNAGLVVGRGVRVDDQMRTSDPAIYAVGECAEHRERIYGLVGPGLEQASVAAHCLAGGRAIYFPSVTATRLKVIGLDVFSIGRVVEDDKLDLARQVTWKHADTSYRKLVIERGRAIGAIAIGKFDELGRVQEAVTHERRVWRWQSWRFRRSGSLWSQTRAESVCTWPAASTVCNCTGVTRGRLGDAIADGCTSLHALAVTTGASTVCGSCRPLLAELLGAGAERRAVGWHRTLVGVSAVVAVAVLALLFAPAMHYSDSVQTRWSWDFLWREFFWKQTSGYGLLALSAIALSLSLRKRWKRVRAGGFDGWRAVHAALGVGMLGLLLAHTGARFGSYLDMTLMACFVGLVALGAGAATIIGVEHRAAAHRARHGRSMLVWAHILLLWPIPLLLGFHIFKSYYY